MVFAAKGNLNRHLPLCGKREKKKNACLKCHFCGAPEGEFFCDVHDFADHALLPICWITIDDLRVNNPERLVNLLAPTRANFELIRDTYDGCQTAFTTDRMGPRRRYDADMSTHLSTHLANLPSTSHGGAGPSSPRKWSTGKLTLAPVVVYKL